MSNVLGGPGFITTGQITSINIHANRALRRVGPSMIFFDGGLVRYAEGTPTTYIPPGIVIGKVTATGLYANSIIGLTNASYTSGGTTLTVTAAVAAEVKRRIGSSGTFKVQGPPTAGGTIAAFTVTFSAVGTTTITVSDLGANVVTKSLILANDGSGVPLTVYDPPDGIGTDVSSPDGTSFNQPVSNLLLGSELLSANIIHLTDCDASCQTWLKGQLQGQNRTFTFDNDY